MTEPGTSASWTARLASATVAYWKYIGKILVPVNLSFFYPFPENPPPALALLAVAGLPAVTAGAWALRREQPCLLANRDRAWHRSVISR